MKAQDDKRWQAVLDRSARPFFYAVTTTGIYCRPDCASRKPKRENVRFFTTTEEAQEAGFRPCKRCEPDGLGEHLSLITKLCRLIEAEGGPIPRQKLSEAACISESQLVRIFKDTLGLTPNQYGEEVRRERLREALPQGESVTRTAQNTGYNSSGHFYKDAEKALAMTPQDFQNGAPEQRIRYAVVPCSLGHMIVAANPKGICHLQMDDDPKELKDRLFERFSKADIQEEDDQLKSWIDEILQALEGPKKLDHLPLDLQGTVFQKTVWHALQQIPPGQTKSYGQLAADLGNPKATRAVARACATNEVSVIVPCHRVIGKNGKLTGFRWGIERKRRLLEAEATPREQ